MSKDSRPVCFTCGQPTGDPVQLNRLPNGQIVHYYCLVAPGGSRDDRRALANAFSWMPANLKPLQ